VGKSLPDKEGVGVGIASDKAEIKPEAAMGSNRKPMVHKGHQNYSRCQTIGLSCSLYMDWATWNVMDDSSVHAPKGRLLMSGVQKAVVLEVL